MNDRIGPRAVITARRIHGAALISMLVTAWPLASGADPVQGVAARPADAVMPHIDAVLDDPAVKRGIAAWGLSLADVRHDVNALTHLERVRLAYVLTRRWRGTGDQAQADLQAQFLVTLSLMRESTLFASIVSTTPSRLR